MHQQPPDNNPYTPPQTAKDPTAAGRIRAFRIGVILAALCAVVGGVIFGFSDKNPLFAGLGVAIYGVGMVCFFIGFMQLKQQKKT